MLEESKTYLKNVIVNNINSNMDMDMDIYENEKN